MSAFVADVSVTLPWCFADEATAWTDGLLEQLRSGGNYIYVPAHWPTEISNGLLMALRRKRIQPGRADLFWDQPAVLPITVEPPLAPERAKCVSALGERYGLTVYDAAYLELARRRNLSLATLDGDLGKAARLEGAAVISPPELTVQ